MTTCMVGTFADPVTRTCIFECNMTLGYYGNTSSHRCVLECADGFYADLSTGDCVSQCPDVPTPTFGDPLSKTCQQQCPPTLFANKVNNNCVTPLNCPVNQYADNYTRVCVNECPATHKTFGEPNTKECVEVCP